MSAPKPFEQQVFVTRPMLPSLSRYQELVAQIWETGWLTNGGGKHAALERELGTFLGSRHVSLFNNGTIALIAACKALRLHGEVITTPFTFPATTHVLDWGNITPVFCDIDPVRLTIDPRRIERLITSRTTGIMGVHVYGIPCHTHLIQDIADAYGLRVVYDAAHAFGTEIDGVPVAEYGDCTMFSFHATKLFHTAEGGALVVKDPELKQRIDLLKNFGIKNEVDVVMPGINGKLNELQAAMGLANLECMDEERAKRARVAAVYRERLDCVTGLECVTLPEGVKPSLQYFVIRVHSGGKVTRDQLYEELKAFNVLSRRYFYPLCSEFSCYQALPSAAPSELPVAYQISREVLALPFYGNLGEEGAGRICDMIQHIMGR
ncbi:DegT/DnrJ/EryC1/StrS aminotransferase family protein [Cupriavidus sp. MP-37]|uniref:DegT/DnrJ/EryC1/StrS family aminotransferase n=1 Tax=Cupriavidus sp. MP-37 TaxID=2884455 RepID=UPI001D0B15B1|nr:DegT/DnrJ/EryC1/StrS family aminotransferase [Cupriavidus sp. MP-37]UDM51225.1 DegT/DnrJ/EryC1/StrS family aminotransferase [Cupriavidus sp. MP-37]